MDANSVTDLPSDLIRKITGELSLADQIRFRFVCQDFLSLPLQNIHKLPWLVNLLETNTPSQISCKLFDPFHEKPYTTSLINIEDDKLFSASYSYCITSKHGWVFLAIGKGDITSFILFSPFTKQIIKLPDFYHCNGRDITFTSDPISKECVFCFLFYDQLSGEFKMCTYKHGYLEWRIIPIWVNDKGPTGIMSMAYFKGDLYYYNRWFLLIYSTVSRPYYNFNTQITNEYKYIENYLVESNGELLVVRGTEHRDRWGIYTFDRASSKWAAKTSLPNTALFVASNLISVPAIEEFKHIENKIFYYDSSQEKSKFYNIIDGKTYACEGTDYEFLVKKHYSQGLWIDYPPHIIEKL